MAIQGTYETILLRLAIGYMHVSLLQQLALIRHAKPLHNLDLEDQKKLETEMIAAVGFVAHNLTEEMLRGEMKPPETIQ